MIISDFNHSIVPYCETYILWQNYNNGSQLQSHFKLKCIQRLLITGITRGEAGCSISL